MGWKAKREGWEKGEGGAVVRRRGVVMDRIKRTQPDLDAGSSSRQVEVNSGGLENES